MNASIILESGDIVFARTGATTGKEFYALLLPQKQYYCKLILYGIRLEKEVDRKYFSYFLNSPDYWSANNSVLQLVLPSLE